MQKYINKIELLTEILCKYFSKHGRTYGIIVISNIATQAVSLAGFMIIARLYKEEQVGDYVTFMAYVGIGTILSTGYYDQALYIERRSCYVNFLKIIPIVFSLFVCFICGLGLLITDVKYVPYILVSVIAGAINLTASNICISENKLVLSSLFKLITGPIVPGSIILAGYIFGPNTQTMIALSGICSLLLSVYFYNIVNPIKKLHFYPDKSRLFIISLALLRRYKKFFFYGMIGELVSTAAYRLPIIQTNSYFGSAYSAYFGIAMRIATTPISILVGSISQIFLNMIVANKKNRISSFDITLKLFILLSIVGLISVGFCLTLAKPIVILLLGSRYEMVGDTIVSLTPFIFSLIAISPLTHVLTVYERQEYAFYNKAAQLILSVCSLFVGVYFNSYIRGVQAFSALMTIVYVAILAEIFSILHDNNKSLNKTVGNY